MTCSMPISTDGIAMNSSQRLGESESFSPFLYRTINFRYFYDLDMVFLASDNLIHRLADVKVKHRPQPNKQPAQRHTTEAINHNPTPYAFVVRTRRNTRTSVR